MNLHMLTGIVLAVLAASGCGLKGPLYLPEKSDVTIRPAPAATRPEAPAEPAPATEQAPAAEPEPELEQPPQDPGAGPNRG
jgi:predicted small lipoprotein YifL